MKRLFLGASILDMTIQNTTWSTYLLEAESNTFASKRYFTLRSSTSCRMNKMNSNGKNAVNTALC